MSDFDASDVGYRQQRDAVAVFLKMLGLWKNERGEFEPAKRQGDNCGNVMLVPGPAGAGKISSIASRRPLEGSFPFAWPMQLPATNLRA